MPGEQRWPLIKNPRFGGVLSEPEYIWIEEDRLPAGRQQDEPAADKPTADKNRLA